MNFCSDNVASAHPDILDYLVEVNRDASRMPYGNDAMTKSVCDDFEALFEIDCHTFPVATGTAANALALAVATPRYGVIFCHEESHIFIDECGAVEQMTAGARLHALPGADGKVDPDALRAILSQGWAGVVHHPQPAALSISQPTEVGTVYTIEEIKTLSTICKDHGLYFHMDGARFANALNSLDVSPAEMTWKSGIDILSFGATKNGAMAAEAVVLFHQDLRSNGQFEFLRKRAGHLFSKMIFVSAQIKAYLGDGLWSRNAVHANAMAQKLYVGLGDAGLDFLYPVQANALFVNMDKTMADGLYAKGFNFYDWPLGGPNCYRLVTCWLTEETDIDAFISAVKASR